LIKELMQETKVANSVSISEITQLPERAGV
jgi:hypothetical protein